MKARNFEGVKHEVLRRKIDHIVNDIHDELSDCYYNYWKIGNSKEFFGYDKRRTQAKSKLQFDVLHGLLHHIYKIMFHKINQLYAQYPESEYNHLTKQGVLVDTWDNVSRQWVKAAAGKYRLNVAGIKTYMINRVRAELGHDIGLD